MIVSMKAQLNYQKHTLIFENDPNISANSIDLFITKIQNKVKDKHKILLEKELRIVD